MPIPNPDKIWPKLEEAGEDEVRKRLSMGVYADYKLPVIKEWLRQKKLENEPVSNQELKNEIPKPDQIIKSLKNHSVISVFVVIAIIIVGLANFTDAVSKLFDLFQSKQHEITSSSTGAGSDASSSLHTKDKTHSYVTNIAGQNSFSIILPPNLSEKLKKIEQEKIEYPERTGDLKILNESIQNGNFNTAIMFSDRVIMRQNNLRAIKHSGMPKSIYDKLNVIKIEKVEYPDREEDLEILNKSIKNGDLDTANMFLDRIVLRQRNLRGIN